MSAATNMKDSVNFLIGCLRPELDFERLLNFIFWGRSLIGVVEGLLKGDFDICIALLLSEFFRLRMNRHTSRSDNCLMPFVLSNFINNFLNS